MDRFSYKMSRHDFRSIRANALVAHIMAIVGKHFSREDDARNAQRDLRRELFDAFYDLGVEIVSDYTRTEMGLPPRSPDGWTNEEIRMRAAIAERNRLRGRGLTASEQLDNLTAALGEHDSDCNGKPCLCGADDFRAKFGPGKHTP